MVINWSEHPGLTEDLLDLKRDSWGASYIAKILSERYNLPITGHKVRNRLSLLREQGQEKVQREEEEKQRTFQDAYREFNRWINRPEPLFTPPKARENGKEKWVIIADPHNPFCDMEALAKIIKEEKDTNGVIVAGDTLDFYSLSRFPKEKDVLLQDEIEDGTAFLQVLAENFPKVYVISDNHSKRAMRYFSERIPMGLMFLVNYNVLELACAGIPNIELVKNEHTLQSGEIAYTSHFLQLGDAVIGHAETSSKIDMRAVKNFEDWLLEWRDFLNLAPWRVVMQAHVHKAGVVYTRGGYAMRMELGCLIKAEGVTYALRGDTKYPPPTLGYTVLVQENGKTDFKETRFIPLCQ